MGEGQKDLFVQKTKNRNGVRGAQPVLSGVKAYFKINRGGEGEGKIDIFL